MPKPYHVAQDTQTTPVFRFLQRLANTSAINPATGLNADERVLAKQCETYDLIYVSAGRYRITDSGLTFLVGSLQHA